MYKWPWFLKIHQNSAHLIDSIIYCVIASHCHIILICPLHSLIVFYIVFGSEFDSSSIDLITSLSPTLHTEQKPALHTEQTPTLHTN